MGSDTSTAALVALLEHCPAAASREHERIRRERGAEAILERELGLFASGAIADAQTRLHQWQRRGWSVVSLSDDEYPMLLRDTAEAPALLFVAGALRAGDERAVAVVGSRKPTRRGCSLAADLTRCLAAGGYAVVSGLAAGVDTVVHRTALVSGGRTIAVIGNGLDHCYPPQNAHLQQRIEREGAVVSQFLPPTRPSRRSFPTRNAVMSGLTVATVIVEASETSGTRAQARFALVQGRRVLLMEGLLVNDWARELAGREGVEVLRTAPEVLDALERRDSVAA
jgi:DNA processing protein